MLREREGQGRARQLRASTGTMRLWGGDLQGGREPSQVARAPCQCSSRGSRPHDHSHPHPHSSAHNPLFPPSLVLTQGLMEPRLAMDSVLEDDLERQILLPLPPKCWDHVPVIRPVRWAPLSSPSH